MANKRFLFLLAVGAGLVTLIGCGSGRGDLSGKVTYKGQAVKSGSVFVKGSDGIEKQGAINADGTYVVEGITGGSAKLSVVSPDPKLSQTRMRKKDEVAPKVEDTGWFPIPDKYGEF